MKDQIMWFKGSWGLYTCLQWSEQIFGWTSDWAFEFKFLQFTRLVFSCNCSMWKLLPNRSERKWRTEVAGGRCNAKLEEHIQILEVWRGNVHGSIGSIEKAWSWGMNLSKTEPCQAADFDFRTGRNVGPQNCDPICGPSVASQFCKIADIIWVERVGRSCVLSFFWVLLRKQT